MTLDTEAEIVYSAFSLQPSHTCLSWFPATCCPGCTVNGAEKVKKNKKKKQPDVSINTVVHAVDAPVSAADGIKKGLKRCGIQGVHVSVPYVHVTITRTDSTDLMRSIVVCVSGRCNGICRAVEKSLNRPGAPCARLQVRLNGTKKCSIYESHFQACAVCGSGWRMEVVSVHLWLQGAHKLASASFRKCSEAVQEEVGCTL